MGNNNESSIIRFIKNIAIFFLGTILSKIISFFMLPLYTSYINLDDYGYYDLSIAYVAIAVSVLFFDIWVTTMRYLYEKESKEWKWKVSQSGFIIFSISLTLLVVIGLILNSIFGFKYFYPILGYAVTLAFSNIFLFIARGYGKNIDYSFSGILNTLVIVVSNFAMIVGLKMDFSSLYIASILGHLVQCVYIESRVKIISKLFKIKWDLTFIKDMFLYSLPLSINSVAYWLLTSFNKIVVQNLMSIEYNGYYAIGSKFGSAISLVTTSFTLAWQDLSFSRNSDDKSNGVYFSKACNKYMTFLGMGACILIPLFSIVFEFFVDDSYYQAKATVPLFIIVAMLNAYSTFIGNIFYAIKDTKSIFYSMLISCLINVLLCYPLIKLYGINGANISIAISFIINISIRSIVLKKKIGFHINKKQMLAYLILLTVTSIIYSTNNSSINILWMLVMISTTIYVLRCDIQMLLKELKCKINIGDESK